MLRVDSLAVSFPAPSGRLTAVHDVSLEVGRGECVGLVGESGSGKTLTALAILGLISPPGTIDRGRIEVEGESLLDLSSTAWQRIRGRRVAMVFQEPTAALNPVLTIGYQLIETLRWHHQLDRTAARREALRLLERVAIAAAADRLSQYPHELSGGQCQRVMLALALAGRPQYLLADEPTTALDMTIQAQILDLLDELRRELNLGVLLVTHDLAVVAECSTRMVVLQAGRVVEQGATETVFWHPKHPYTRSLLDSRFGGSASQRGHLE